MTRTKTPYLPCVCVCVCSWRQPMRVDWCVSSWFRIKNTHFLTHTNIPEGELLTGFAMRSDPNVVFG